MLKGLKKFFLKMMAGANIVTVIIMLLVGMAGRLSPAEHPMLTNAGLLYPVFLLINLAFMIFWLTFHWKGVLIPIVGYLLCYGSLRVYLPLNMPADAPDDAIKVMTYNVCRFAKGSIRDDGTNPVIEYIKQSGADIVCLQEASSDLISQKDISRELSKVYEYGDTVVRHYSGNTIAIYSKYPIVGKERIEFDSKWNISAAFKVLIDGDTVMVVNNHLETNKLLEDEQQKFKKMTQYDLLNKSINDIFSRTILTSLTTMLASVALLIFGGDALRSFAFVITAGAIIGTYSSIYVSVAALNWFDLRKAAAEAEKDVNPFGNV